MGERRPRLLLLLPTTTYRTAAFVEAALRLDIDLTVASERDSAFSDREPSGFLTLDFRRPDVAAEQAAQFARRHPLDAVFGVDDDTAVAAAVIAEALGLPHNPVAAVQAARDKLRQRELHRAAGVPVPDFRLASLDEPANRVAEEIHYPAVIKPLYLSASRGVMRVDDPAEFIAARARLQAILGMPDVRQRKSETAQYLVETFVSGPEFAFEGLLLEGRLQVLALFDKPDPLDGPYFEETIYVTPSRHPSDAQRALVDCAARAAQAVGLVRGPVHVELRHNDAGPWLIELAARPIGGRCGQALRFDPEGVTSLEELLLADALGQVREVPPRERAATGVMMIPIPRAGVFRRVDGLEEAAQVARITGVHITVHPGQRLVPLPEESRYLGFIFARAPAPEAVERALRTAHASVAIVLE